jgi:hypothetical protein
MSQPANVAELNWLPVVSSHISAYAYDASAFELHVKYSDGSLYTFLHVPAAVVTGLEAAASKGKYLRAAVRPYLYRRILARKG